MGFSSKYLQDPLRHLPRPDRGDGDLGKLRFVGLGAGGDVESAAGSRRRMRLNGVIAVSHRPHPQPTMKKRSVESAREFLLKAGISPGSEGCVC